jgi:hypothetical protein
MVTMRFRLLIYIPISAGQRRRSRSAVCRSPFSTIPPHTRVIPNEVRALLLLFCRHLEERSDEVRFSIARFWSDESLSAFAFAFAVNP